MRGALIFLMAILGYCREFVQRIVNVLHNQLALLHIFLLGMLLFARFLMDFRGVITINHGGG